jgi:hypothetical protein
MFGNYTNGVKHAEIRCTTGDIFDVFLFLEGVKTCHVWGGNHYRELLDNYFEGPYWREEDIVPCI